MMAKYAISSAIVWAAIILACAVILKGTHYLSQLLPILGGGAAWNVIIAPAAFGMRQGRPPAGKR